MEGEEGNWCKQQLLTSGQLMLSQSLHSGNSSMPGNSPRFDNSAQCHRYGTSFGQCGPAALAVSPPSSLSTPRYLTGRAAAGAEQSLALLSTALQQLNYQFVISTISIKNLKYSIMQATMKKINPIPVKTLTVCQQVADLLIVSIVAVLLPDWNEWEEAVHLFHNYLSPRVESLPHQARPCFLTVFVWPMG